MIYRNKRTGEVVKFNGEVRGNLWEAVMPPKASEEKKPENKTTGKKGKK